MNSFFRKDIKPVFGDSWTPRHASAAKAIREFLSPPGKENRDPYLHRRVQYQNATGIGNLVKGLNHMNDRCLLATVLWLGSGHPVYYAMAVGLLVKHFPAEDQPEPEPFGGEGANECILDEHLADRLREYMEPLDEPWWEYGIERALTAWHHTPPEG